MTNDERDRSLILAFEDLEFLKREELRPVRLMLELMKPEMLQREAGVRSTIVVFGSARMDENAPYYGVAREFARIVSQSCQIDGRCEYVIVTGGGPGIMEAANRGAADAGAKSIGLNIVLPHEQHPNPYVSPGLGFTFHYFALRKMHFMLRAKALVVFPGGFGTMDELFEALTLVQTGKVEHLPVVLVGRAFWENTLNFRHLVDEGMITTEDLDLFRYAETAEEAWGHVLHYHATHKVD
jgi:uncharacterized protein (TIGR00730 family)